MSQATCAKYWQKYFTTMARVQSNDVTLDIQFWMIGTIIKVVGCLWEDSIFTLFCSSGMYGPNALCTARCLVFVLYVYKHLCVTICSKNMFFCDTPCMQLYWAYFILIILSLYYVNISFQILHICNVFIINNNKLVIIPILHFNNKNEKKN